MSSSDERELMQLLNRVTSRVAGQAVSPVANAFGRGFVAAYDGTHASVRKSTRDAEPTPGFDVSPSLTLAEGDFVWYFELGSDRRIIDVIDRNAVTGGTGGGSTGGAPTTASYLVGAADPGLTNEIVVGNTPGGELSGTWDTPTVDPLHGGSTHAATQAAAESTASGALASHAGAADPHTGYRLESASIGTADLANDAVTYAKMQNVSATSRLLGRKTAAAGDPEELTAAEAIAFLVTARGDLITRDATGVVRKAIGTLNQFLVSDGTDVQWRSRKRWDVEKAISVASSTGFGAATSFATATENGDTDAFHDQTTNPSRFTCPVGGDGLYMIEAHSDHKGDLSTAGVRRIAIAKNLGGTAVDATGPYEGYQSVTVGTNSGQGLVQCTALVAMVAGDYVEVFYMQNSGTARSVNFYCRGVLLGAT